MQNLRNQLPKNAEVAGAIAEFYLAARNPDAAIKEYQRGLSIDPKNEQLQVALAETYLMIGPPRRCRQARRTDSEGQTQ